MPSPKQPSRSVNPSVSSIATSLPKPAASASSSSAAVRSHSPDDVSPQSATDIELDSIGASSSQPRRRASSLLRGVGNRPRTQSLLGTTAATRIRENESSDGGNGTNSNDGWDDAWGDNDAENGSRDNIDNKANGNGAFLDEGDDLHDDEETGLSPTERRQRAEARRQRTRLDERIVPGGAGDNGQDFAFGDDDDDPDSGLIMAAITAAERKEADQTVIRRLLINGSLIGLWYLFSLSISLYNKWMFGSNFPFPLFTTSVHMLVQFFLACLVLYFVPSLRPGNGGARFGRASSSHGEDAYKSSSHGRSTESSANRSMMTGWFYLTRIGPCGAATGLDIGLGNASLKLITLTFYTMCKSSSLAFVLLFAFAFRLETPTLRLVAIIATMTVGVVMMVAGEVEFDLTGFFLVISAAFFSGFRWGLTQIMLLRNPATSNPFSSIFYLAPVMFVTLFLLAIPIEGFGELAAGFRALADKFGLVRTPLLVLFPGTIAFLMTASEFALLQRTSVVTLSIAGIFKEVVTITMATLVFHDKLTLVNLLGLVITMAAITVYNYIKITKMRQQAQIDVHKGHHTSAARRSTEEENYAAAVGGEQSSSSPSPPPHESMENGDSDAEGEADSENAGLLPKAPSRSGP